MKHATVPVTGPAGLAGQAMPCHIVINPPPSQGHWYAGQAGQLVRAVRVSHGAGDTYLSDPEGSTWSGLLADPSLDPDQVLAYPTGAVAWVLEDHVPQVLSALEVAKPAEQAEQAKPAESTESVTKKPATKKPATTKRAARTTDRA